MSRTSDAPQKEKTSQMADETHQCDDMTTRTCIELFAGAGGLALGLEQAGFDHLVLSEINHDACMTLRENRPEWNIIEQDIAQVDFTGYAGKVDLVSGGFPCQAFSMAGKRMGFGDTRGTLFAQFVRCVNEVRPKMILFENVKGLVSHDKGRTLATILHSFEEAGYDIRWKVLNASRLGVGQKRERIVGIGIRKDLMPEVAEAPDMPDLPSDARFDDDGTDTFPYEFPAYDGHVTTLADALRDVPESPGTSYSEKKKAILDLVPPGGCWVDLPDDIAKAYLGGSYKTGGGKRGMARRIAWDEPCLTLTTSPSQKQTERCHPDETRPFTTREYARIQSFPDDWEFYGGIGSIYRQIGNAVPVEMARRVGASIVECLDRLEGTASAS